MAGRQLLALNLGAGALLVGCCPLAVGGVSDGALSARGVALSEVLVDGGKLAVEAGACGLLLINDVVQLDGVAGRQLLVVDNISYNGLLGE